MTAKIDPNNIKPEYRVRTQAEIEDIGKIRGVICVWPSENELAIDLDEPFAYNSWDGSQSLLCALHDHGVVEMPVNDSLLKTKSPGGNTHIYIRLEKPMNMQDRVALQAALGSDPLKEGLSVLGHITCLFETPDQAKLVENWRSVWKSKEQ